MSVGAWALVAFGVFATVSFVGALADDRVVRLGLTDWVARRLHGAAGKLWSLLGLVLGLFIAGYTGVLLAVSNQPVWSDTWALGALFLASGLTGAAAVLRWLVYRRADARGSIRVFDRFERFFPLLEFALIVVFVVLLVPPGTLGRAFAFPWSLLWVVAVVGLLPGLGGLMASRRSLPADAGAGSGAAAEGAAALPASRSVAWVALLVLLSVLALRAAVIFSGQ